MAGSEPLGIELFNPGNIRQTTIHWRGQDLDYKGQYCKFEAPEWGIRAMAKILDAYEARGIKTLREAIRTWAPPAENDTEAYVSDVCQRVGIGPDTVTHLATLPVIKAIIWHEQGSCPYPDSQILLGMTLAKPTPES